MERLPDVLFNMVLTFCTSAEIVGWTAEAVRTKDRMAPKLLQLAKSIQRNLDTMPPFDVFWAFEGMLAIPTPPRFQGIDFESAMFWLLHKQFITEYTGRTDVMSCELFEIDRVMKHDRMKPFANVSEMCFAITRTYFGTCNIADRFFIQ